MINEIIVFLAIVISIYILSLIVRGGGNPHGPHRFYILDDYMGGYGGLPPKMVGGSRSAIFSRFKYIPQYPFMSKFDIVDYNLFSKSYNTAGRLKIMVGRPYRNYTMPDGNWGYPWHFPEPADHVCLKLAETRCGEEVIQLNKTPDQKLGGLGVTAPKDIIRPSKCFDYVYQQCRNGVDPLLIRVKNIGVYDD